MGGTVFCEPFVACCKQQLKCFFRSPGAEDQRATSLWSYEQMNAKGSNGPITIFTPSIADAGNTNAQNVTAKEIVARLPPELFRVVMICGGEPDPRIATRKNTELLPYHKHGNAAILLMGLLRCLPDIYFFPREGPLDSAFLLFRKYVGLRTAMVTYAVSGGLDRGDAPPARIRNIREADAVLGNSRYLTEVLRQRLGVEASTVYDGIDRRFFFPREKHEGSALTVLYAGSFRPYKRVDLVVRQAARLPRVEFRIAGSGEEEPACRRLAEQLGCSNVRFLGHLTPSQLGEEMRTAQVFFFPSTLEGHPQVLGQAAACGLPAIAMNVYRPEYVVSGKTGFLVESDPELSARLDLLLENTALRGAMSEAAVRHARNFDWEQIVEQWVNVFQDVVAVGNRHHQPLQYS
jgi:glycosyltransferase involved in cell wall biosynthesis